VAGKPGTKAYALGKDGRQLMVEIPKTSLTGKITVGVETVR
jgi:hypothetical protein